MIHEFTKENIQAIGNVLGVTPKPFGTDVFRFEVSNEDAGTKLALEIHLGLELEGKRMNLVSVYSGTTFLQLHNCTAFIASDLLKQVTFFGKQGEITTGLIVEQSAGCSMYANVNESILTGDFTKLPEDVMMCGVALSLTESADLDDFSFDDENLS
ncbi:hypothetical protein [Rhodohalobacter mucosus]|uniref:Uncharacterized protein n=1 Tax=Rhodohalobacter mucosus TaxID=2079485 RepID=A0A316TR60_9BACT|nr:hypothetical protein [Rhodohalobacter mucosus]PWN07093.1 hypothetical protein DDZ15_07450 [Rhodohalobacter mucosus]